MVGVFWEGCKSEVDVACCRAKTRMQGIEEGPTCLDGCLDIPK